MGLLRRRRVDTPPPTGGVPLAGIGMYQGYQLPQDPSAHALQRTHSSLFGPMGIRMAGQSRRGYFGTDAVPNFPLVKPRINRQVDLEVSPIKTGER